MTGAPLRATSSSVGLCLLHSVGTCLGTLYLQKPLTGLFVLRRKSKQFTQNHTQILPFCTTIPSCNLGSKWGAPQDKMPDPKTWGQFTTFRVSRPIIRMGSSSEGRCFLSESLTFRDVRGRHRGREKWAKIRAAQESSWLCVAWPSKRGTVGTPLSSGQAWLLISARETSRPSFVPTWLGTLSILLALSSLHVYCCYLVIKMQTHIRDALFETLGSWCVLELRKPAWSMYYLICNTHTSLGSRQYPYSYTLICTVGKSAMKKDEFTVSSLLSV